VATLVSTASLAFIAIASVSSWRVVGAAAWDTFQAAVVVSRRRAARIR